MEESKQQEETQNEKKVSNKTQILLVEDSPADARFLEILLKKSAGANRYWLIHVKKISKALKLLSRYSFDIILLDLSLPDSHGLDSIETMHEAAPHIPIVVLTGTNNEGMISEALRKGVQDYLIKGSFDERGLTQAISYAIERNKFQFQTDPTQKLLEQSLEMALRQAQRNAENLCFFLIQLKPVNTEVNKLSANLIYKRLVSCLRKSDVIAFTEKKDWGVILPHIHSFYNAQAIAKRIRQTFSEPLAMNGQSILFQPKIGISLYPTDATTTKELLAHATIALQNGNEKDTAFKFYSRELQQKTKFIQSFENELQIALQTGTLSLRFQPQINLNTEDLTGLNIYFEGQTSDGTKFMTHQMPHFGVSLEILLPLYEWFTKKVIEAMKKFQQLGFVPLKANLNLSALPYHHLYSLLSQSLNKNSWDPKYLSLQLSLKNRPWNRSMLQTLKEKGIEFVLEENDSFSSLASLKEWPIDVLKIAPELLQDFPQKTEGVGAIRALIQFARSHKIKTFAEPVTNEEQWEALRALNCDFAQGNYISEALTFEECILFLKMKHFHLVV